MSEDVSSEGSAHAGLPKVWRLVRPAHIWWYWGVIAFVWLRVLFLILGFGVSPASPANMFGYVLFATVMSFIAIYAVAKRHWLLRIDEQGVQLETRRQVRWRVPRADLRTWQPEVVFGGLRALRVTDQGGGVWRVDLGNGLNKQTTEQVIEALRQWAPDDTELPASSSPIPWWGYCIAVVFTIGVGIFLYLMLR
ncbi:MAG: hypothetical protein ABFD94_00165 [Armatimonadia bacterium]